MTRLNIPEDFDVSLTVHLSITLANDQLDAQTFLIHLLQSSTCFEQYLGGQIVLTQHLVSSLSGSDRPVHGLRTNSFLTCAPNGHFMRVTIPDAVLIQFDLLRMSKILLETCRRL